MAAAKKKVPEWPKLRPQGTDTAYWCDECGWVHESELILEESEVFHLDPSLNVCEKRLLPYRVFYLGREISTHDAERGWRRYHDE